MSLEHAILGFLNTRARSGYDLKTRCFDVEAKAFWSADQAQIYRTLERLKTARLVNATVRRQSGKPDRKLYEITPAGTRRLRAMGDHRSTPLGPQGRLPAPGLLLGRGVRRRDRDAAVLSAGRPPGPPGRSEGRGHRAFEGSHAARSCRGDAAGGLRRGHGDRARDHRLARRHPGSNLGRAAARLREFFARYAEPPFRMGAGMTSCAQDTRSASC